MTFLFEVKVFILNAVLIVTVVSAASPIYTVRFGMHELVQSISFNVLITRSETCLLYILCDFAFSFLCLSRGRKRFRFILENSRDVPQRRNALIERIMHNTLMNRLKGNAYEIRGHPPFFNGNWWWQTKTKAALLCSTKKHDNTYTHARCSYCMYNCWQI